ncbi:CE1759 family FMN reductase [Streptomyces sp. NPDC004042]|uniref:CE1759 family FMN reductase n=1 Tax=Streptomyces sp. NPDC004042 TaxID=3154451 RepID=UPI0033AB30D4
MKLVVVSAGLSVPSSTRLLADRLAAATAGRTDARVRVIEVRDLAVAIAHNLTSGFPGPELAAALDAVTEADALIAVTPVFSASYSGLFKSFFDVLGAREKDALAGKPVLIAATGGTARHSMVLDHALRPLFAYLRAVVVPTGVYAASEDWGAEGLPERIERAAGELAALAAPAAPASPDAPGAPGAPGAPAAPVGGGADSAGRTVPGEQAVPGQPPVPGQQGRAADGGLAVVPFEEQLARLRG